MPIRVTCPGCHTRFNVSEKFAGREGPCPKCRKPIHIPDQSEEVVIATPDDGPKDSKGRSIVKPIQRAETSISNIQWTVIAVCVVGFLAGSAVLRVMTGGDSESFPIWLMAVAALVIAPPIVYVAYQMLRDQDLGTFGTGELRNRVGICSLVYALLWLAMPLGYIAFNDHWDLGAWLTGMIPMLALGALTGMLLFDLDYVFGLVHYGLYLGICLLGRWISGVGVLPGNKNSSISPGTATTWNTDLWDRFSESLSHSWTSFGSIWIG